MIGADDCRRLILLRRQVPETNSASPLYSMGACISSVLQAPHTPRVILSGAQRSRRIPSLVTDERPLRHLSVPPLPQSEAHTRRGGACSRLCVYIIPQTKPNYSITQCQLSLASANERPLRHLSVPPLPRCEAHTVGYTFPGGGRGTATRWMRRR